MPTPTPKETIAALPPDAVKAAVCDETELLGMHLGNIKTEIAREIMRTRLLSLVIEQIGQMSVFRAQDLARAIDLITHDQGSATPVEYLLTQLLHEHYSGEGITPETLEEQLDPKNNDSFRVNFEDWMRNGERYKQAYSKLLNQTT